MKEQVKPQVMMSEREFWMERRRLLMAELAAIETWLRISPTSSELRAKGQEYYRLLSKGSLFDPEQSER